MDAVWALLLAAAAAIVVTYTRLSPATLYNVSEEGPELGLGRALVFVNYPVSLVAIPIAWLAADRIGSRRATSAAVAATVLCGVSALPGVVDQHDLDAKPVNVLPAIGVAIVLALSVRAPWERVGRLPLDPVRLGIGVVVWVVALVWVASVLGFYFPGDVLLGEDVRRGGDGRLGPAVHRGDHEGLDAALLVTAALVLTRYRPRFAIAWLLGLALAYGLAVEWRDFWFEQVTKRGWTDWVPPQVLTPRLSVAWAALVLLGLAVALVLRRLEGPPRRG
ncbi:MAG TPA: hypothetical protein VFM13_04835 [Gaiellaceae bacterium]|nr:hypothetical protein [Gaiellaceae bacterium]